MIEVTLNADSFMQNPTFKNEIAALRQIYNLIVMKPGTDPLNPTKGCDINQYYFRYKSDLDGVSLEQIIKAQIDTYTDYKIADVTVKPIRNAEKWVLNVFVSIVGSDKTLACASNGDFTNYTIVDSLTQELFEEGNNT